MTGVPLLHRAPGFLAVDKPAGALVIPGRGEAQPPSIKERLEAELGVRLYVVHRLDRDTSGVLLFALDAPAHRALSMAFEAGQIAKRYLALVEGRVEGPLELTYPLVAARRGRMRTARGSEAGKPAHTRVRPVQVFEGASLVEAEPLTGRQHQIRVHLAAAGHPLLVDPQYGRPPREGLPRTPLHAASLAIPALPGIAAVEIAAPLPADLVAAAQTLERVQRSINLKPASTAAPLKG